VPRSYDRKTEGGSKNLAAAFAVRAVEREDIHLYLPYGIGAFTNATKISITESYTAGAFAYQLRGFCPSQAGIQRLQAVRGGIERLEIKGLSTICPRRET
jgi:hypothetical protein